MKLHGRAIWARPFFMSFQKNEELPSILATGYGTKANRAEGWLLTPGGHLTIVTLPSTFRAPSGDTRAIEGRHFPKHPPRPVADSGFAAG